LVRRRGPSIADCSDDRTPSSHEDVEEERGVSSLERGSLHQSCSWLAGLVATRAATRTAAKARRGRESSHLVRPSRTRVPDELMYGGGHMARLLGDLLGWSRRLEE